jgi:hypothetical protein
MSNESLYKISIAILKNLLENNLINNDEYQKIEIDLKNIYKISENRLAFN